MDRIDRKPQKKSSEVTQISEGGGKAGGYDAEAIVNMSICYANEVEVAQVADLADLALRRSAKRFSFKSQSCWRNPLLGRIERWHLKIFDHEA